MASTAENLRITTDFTLRLIALLRQNGVEIGTQQSLTCLQSILLSGTVDQDELRLIYQITLINRKQDLWQLHRSFELLMKDYIKPRLEDTGDPEKEKRAAVVTTRRQYTDADTSSGGADGELARTQGYSVREVDHHKDFRLLPRQDFPAAMTQLRKIARKHASLAWRKARRAGRRGRIDLRSTVRESAKSDGEILNWRFRRKRPTRSRFVIVADVSGSMEIYSIFLLNFLHHLNSGRRLKIESFVFSTRLERLTRAFRTRGFQDMLRNVSLLFPAWAGGTKIGAAIQALNETYGTLVTRKTNVIILSDGWDTGDIALLDREMATLRARAKSIWWMNPLKGAPSYEPLALGMATARPYCDEFISGHSVDALERFARLIWAVGGVA